MKFFTKALWGLLPALLVCGPLFAQDDFLADWFQRSDQAKASQPHWITPLATVTPRLEQEFRTDFFRQPMASGHDLLNLGGGKGLELIPNERVELLLNVPPYLKHNDPVLADGFGDVSFVGKYRLLAASEEHGNYILTAFLGTTIPTGSHRNGGRSGVITTTVAAGKGWGKFDVQGTLAVAQPTSHTNALGHSVTSNTALQFHALDKLWPELEVNSTFWKGGAEDGKKQVFLTPGILFGRFRLRGRLVLAFGAGFQIAVTQFHNYNHAGIFSVRFPF